MTLDAMSANKPVEVEPANEAWQPVTPAGVAAFADATLGRLLLIQSIAAAVITLVVVWFINARWLSVLEDAIGALPETGEISRGTLKYPIALPQRLGENGFLGIAVDLDHTGAARSASHVFLEFGRMDCHVLSLLGYTPLYYPSKYSFHFNRPELQPRWAAWKPAILGLVAAAVFTHLLIVWWLFASIYLLPVWLYGFFADRVLSLAGAWKSGGAAMIPGGLFFALALMGYGWALLDLPRLLLALAIHLVLGWCYLVLAVLARPKIDYPTNRSNPFGAAP